MEDIIYHVDIYGTGSKEEIIKALQKLASILKKDNTDLDNDGFETNCLVSNFKKIE